MKKENLVEIVGLKKYFPVGKNKTLKAVDDVTFNIKRGETFGLVGESGCGKTTCGRTVVGLYKPTEGKIIFDGLDVQSLSGKEKLKFKKRAQIIFQDPYASLDPRMTVGEIIGEGMDVHFNYSKAERREKINKLLSIVGLNHEHGSRFAHELSGGQRQRIGIARALAVEPDFIMCDEPISALDVSIQAQIVNLLIRLQREMGLTYLFISHDLSMVKHISDTIGVMYLGSMVERAPNEKLYSKPLHPYTQALISAIPVPDPDVEDNKEVIKLDGEVPSPINTPSGCKFRTRCRYAKDICKDVVPKLKKIEKDHFVACHLYE
ncbi:ABC transporter ATP-binding protein [Clostridium sp. Cult1]|uniref:ABC transporter ATP-binding protein n=1 Tax=Clostridium sp. Cult1 TaxID=2079002 RepID=UPI001F418F55|nr:ABC transporter ATP-binding protein [Clostridium sp. Cult1]MCF6462957.1 oligopeptide ABC transporter ATP-binding protein OppF [Clostridium sp. Cult1]